MSTTYQPPVYIDVTETAKLVRAALKAAFPGIKFRVRAARYAGGASIAVRWTDGPTEEQVREVTSQYEGSGFDGMIDLKYSVYHEVDGQKVHYGADHVSPIRSYSVPFLRARAEEVCQQWGVGPVPRITTSEYDGRAQLDWNSHTAKIYPSHNRYSIGDLIYEHAHDTPGT